MSDTPRTQEDKETNETSPENHLAAKRGRMIGAGVIATLTLALIAILVYGVFHVTAGWFIKCPSDVAVNDPAPRLWERLDSEKTEPAGLGVPEQMQQTVALKNGTAEESD